MSTAISSDSAPASAPSPVDLRHRHHTLRRDRTFIQNLGLALQRWLEARVAAASPLGDPNIYRKADFPWAAEIEKDWREVRRELDAVMVFRDRMPSFQDRKSVV